MRIELNFFFCGAYRRSLRQIAHHAISFTPFFCLENGIEHPNNNCVLCIKYESTKMWESCLVMESVGGLMSFRSYVHVANGKSISQHRTNFAILWIVLQFRSYVILDDIDNGNNLGEHH